MKRSCPDSPEGGRRAAAMVSLNVGGKHFDSSPDTLIQAQYFEPYLQGRLQHSADPRGRLFVDRDPELFAVLLQFLRAQTLPPQSYIKLHHQALLEECRFFQIPHLEHHLCGHTSIFDLRLEDRQIKERESEVRCMCEDRSFVLDVFETCTLPRDANELKCHC